MSLTHVKYAGTALPTDSDTFVLFTTVETGKGQNFLPMLGIETFEITVKCSHAGTFKGYASKDRGTNWVQVSETAIAASPSTGSDSVSILVGSYADWKLSWVNGGTTQTTFVLNMALSTNVAM